MLKFPENKKRDFLDKFQTHKVNVAACNIFFQTIRMLNGQHMYLDRDSYKEHFLMALSDIELVTPPTDAFVPNDAEDHSTRLFEVNRLSAEYLEIVKRLPANLIEDAFGPASALVVLIKNDPEKLDIIYDDIFIYYNLFKYIDQIDMIRLNMFSNYTDIIEYVVTNFTFADWKSFLISKKVNPEKYAKNCEDILFNPDIAATQKFYINNTNENIPTFNLVDLLMRLTSNIVFKTDIIFILAVYEICSFAMGEFANKQTDTDPKCRDYVTNVLSKL